MFTLHDTIELTKKIIIFTVIGAVGIFVLFLLFKFGVFLKNTFFPTPPPAAQVAFGKLPRIQFGESDAGDYTYSVDTLSGTLPIMHDRVNVYKIKEPVPELYDLARVKSKAKNIDFSSEPQMIGENIYQWKNNTELQPTFTINSLTDDFTYKTAFLTYAPIANGSGRIGTDTGKNTALQFFRSLNSLPPTINIASTSAKALMLRNGILSEASSIATTEIIRVDFYRYTVDSLPIKFPDHPESLMYALVGGGDNAPIILEASYVNKEISDEFSDYPIKTTSEAYAELEAGNGYIATYYGNETEIKIKNVQLGYYMSQEPQEYLMPVYVFTGDDGYAAFVSAIQDTFIGK